MKKFLCVIFIITIFVAPSMAMTEEQRTKCHWIINSAATAAAGSAAALAQAPGADNAAFVGIMGVMSASLAEVFDIDMSGFSSHAHAMDIVVMTILAQAGGAMMTRTASQYLVGWIPFLGNSVNAASMAIMVELIGWKIAKAYDNNEFASMGLVKRTAKAAADKALSVTGLDTDTIMEYVDGFIDDKKK